MSPLTKIFVMLLVVTSLLNAAATVVYVNKEQLTDLDYKSLANKNSSLQRDYQAAQADAATARGQLMAQEQQSATEGAARQGALDKANADMSANNVTLQAQLDAQTKKVGELQESLGAAAKKVAALASATRSALTRSKNRVSIPSTRTSSSAFRSTAASTGSARRSSPTSG